MKLTVLMSSGEEDDWEDVDSARLDMDLGGTLVLLGPDDAVLAMYAPGMWMKLEYLP